LSTLNGQLPLPGSSLTLHLGEDSSATGSDGCNRFSTTYTASRSTISFEPAASTMMACPPAVATQANDYMTALGAATRYQLRGGQLILLDGTTALATFVASREDLAGTTWLVTGYNNGQEAVVSPLLGADIIINLDDANLISGNAGCNDFFAQVQASNGIIEIDGVGATRRTCATPSGVMEQETEFFAALESAATYTIDGDFIELRNADDAIAVHMVRELDRPRDSAERRQHPLRSGHQLPRAGCSAFRRHRRNYRPQRGSQLVGCRGASRAGRQRLGFGRLCRRQRCRRRTGHCIPAPAGRDCAVASPHAHAAAAANGHALGADVVDRRSHHHQPGRMHHDSLVSGECPGGLGLPAGPALSAIPAHRPGVGAGLPPGDHHL
jgi:heat shock protein HslJ